MFPLRQNNATSLRHTRDVERVGLVVSLVLVRHVDGVVRRCRRVAFLSGVELHQHGGSVGRLQVVGRFQRVQQCHHCVVVLSSQRQQYNSNV